jgi:hypothetical protein
MTMTGILSTNMPAILSDVNYLSPLRYSVRNLAPYTLRSIEFTCDAAQQLPDGSCTYNTGEQVLQLYNLDVDPRWQLLGLGCCAVVYRVAAYGLLKLKRGRWAEGWKEWRDGKNKEKIGASRVESGEVTV